MAEEKEPLSIELEGFGGDFGEFTLTESRMIHALKAFILLRNVEQACKAAEITRDTWYRWKRQHAGFNLAYQRILEYRLDAIEEKAYELAEDGDRSMMQFMLKALRQRYQDRQTITVVSPDVQRRLVAQADAILQTCAMELPEPYRSTFPAKLAAALETVWT